MFPSRRSFRENEISHGKVRKRPDVVEVLWLPGTIRGAIYVDPGISFIAAS
jgi:hypothetical protein